MSMFYDIDCGAKGNEELCENNSKRVGEYARKFSRSHWSFVGLGKEKKWYATYNRKPNGSWDRTAQKMMQIFRRSVTQSSVVRVPWERTLKKTKEEERQQYTSQDGMRMFSCSSR